MRFARAAALIVLAGVAMTPTAASAQPAPPLLWEVELRLDPAVADQTLTSTPVVSVTVSASPSLDGYIARLTNNRNRPLEAWGVDIDFENGTGLGQRHDTFPSEAAPGQLHGPIAPGETREIRFRTSQTGRLRDVRVSGVLFDDSHFEGHHATRESWFRGREAYGAEVSDWLVALRAAAAASDAAAARDILLAKLAEHRQMAEDGARSHAELTSRSVDDTMAQILEQLAAKPEAWGALLDYFLRRFERIREWGFRHR